MLFANMTTEQKKECLEKYRYINVEEASNWDDAHIGTFKDTLEEKGFRGVEVTHSNSFSSQGDGASFTFTGLNAALFFKGAFENPNTPEYVKEFLNYTEFKGERWDHRYVHENSVKVEINYDNVPETNPIAWDEMKGYNNIVKEFVVSSSRELFQELSKVYDDLISDEEVASTLIAYEYNFNVYDMSIRDSSDQGLTIKEQAALLISTAKVMISADVSPAEACSNAFDGDRRGFLMAEGIDRERADNLLEVELSQMVE